MPQEAAGSRDRPTRAVADAGVLALLLSGAKISDTVSKMLLPPWPSGLSPKERGLSNRATNALVRAAFFDSPTGLPLAIETALKLRGFGRQCLIDYLQCTVGLLAARDGNEIQPTVSLFRQRVSFSTLLAFADDPIPTAVRRLYFPLLSKDVSLEVLQLSNRARKALASARIDRERLCAMTIDELLDVPGFGSVCLNDLVGAIITFEKAAARVPQDDTHVRRLLRIAKRFPACRAIADDDPRFGQVLRALGVTSLETLIAQVQQPLFYASNVPVLARLVKQLRRAHVQTLHDEAQALYGYPRRSRRNAIAMAYLGFTGGPLKTLEEVGTEHGITRERVRQVSHPKQLRGRGRGAYLPRLDAALALLRRDLPERADVLIRRLKKRSLADDLTTVPGIVRYAEILDRPSPGTLVKLRHSVLLHPDDRPALATVLSAARRLITYNGATTVQHLSEARGCTARGLSQARIARWLQVAGHFEEVTGPGGWFTLKGVHDLEIHKLMCFVLRVAGTLSLQDLRFALRREYRRGGHVPPEHAFRAVVERCRFIRREGDRLSLHADAATNFVDRSTDEGIVVEVLRQLGGVAARRPLQRALEERGVSIPSAWRILVYSPLITRFAPGVYGLVGANPPFGMVDELKSLPTTEGGLIRHGWSPDRRLWIAYRLSEATLETGVVGLPAALATVLQGDFTITDTADASGFVRVNGHSIWGLRKLLPDADAEPGECLVLRFDVVGRRVEFEVGDESVVDAAVEDEAQDSRVSGE